jgi:hypothetical protein
LARSPLLICAARSLLRGHSGIPLYSSQGGLSTVHISKVPYVAIGDLESAKEKDVGLSFSVVVLFGLDQKLVERLGVDVGKVFLDLKSNLTALRAHLSKHCRNRVLDGWLDWLEISGVSLQNS